MNDPDSYTSALAITEVVNRYFATLDERKLDVETLNGIFTTDAKIVRPHGSITVGPQAIGESHAENFSRFRATQHIASGSSITHVSIPKRTFAGISWLCTYGQKAKATPTSIRMRTTFLRAAS